MSTTVWVFRLETSCPIQAPLLFTTPASATSSSCGSRALRKAMVLAWLAMAAMLAVFRPGMRVPVIQRRGR